MPQMLKDSGYYTFGIGKMHWHPQQELLQIDTTNILFICGGAFDGISYMVSIIRDSMIERSPLAHVFLSTAMWAIAISASSVNSSFTPSRSRSA